MIDHKPNDNFRATLLLETHKNNIRVISRIIRVKGNVCVIYFF